MANEQELIAANVEAIVNLQVNSIQTQKTGNPDMVTWQPPAESEVSLGDSKPITFVRDRLIASNTFRTDDIEILTSLEPLGESRQLNFSGNWSEIEALMLKDKMPLMVKVKDRDPKVAGSQSEYQLRTLRIKEANGQRQLYHVDMLQADNEMALENSQFSTEITDKNHYSVYPAVVRTKDLRAEFKGIGPKIENKILTRFLSFGNLDLDAAQKSYLKPIIAAAQNKILPPLKAK